MSNIFSDLDTYDEIAKQRRRQEDERLLANLQFALGELSDVDPDKLTLEWLESLRAFDKIRLSSLVAATEKLPRRSS